MLYKFILLTIINLTLFIYIVKSFNKVDLFQYKIKNYYVSVFLVIIYITFFFILLYAFRIYMLKDITDLSFIPKYLKLAKDNLIHDPIYSITYFFFIGSVLLVGIGLFACLNKFFFKHMLRLHVYYYGKSSILGGVPGQRRGGRYENFVQDIHRYGDKLLLIKWLSEFFQYLIIIFTPYYERHVFADGSVMYTVDYNKIAKSHPLRILVRITYNRHFNNAFFLSPLLLILEDCIFNDFQIRYLSYYMLFYTPMLILYRIGNYFFRSANLFMVVLYKIYYIEEKEMGVYAASPFHKNIIDMYLRNGLVDSPGSKLELEYGLNEFMYLYNGLWFIRDYNEPDIYMNNLGHYIIVNLKSGNNTASLFKYHDDGSISIEHKMFILAIKHGDKG